MQAPKYSIGGYAVDNASLLTPDSGGAAVALMGSVVNVETPAEGRVKALVAPLVPGASVVAAEEGGREEEERSDEEGEVGGFYGCRVSMAYSSTKAVCKTRRWLKKKGEWGNKIRTYGARAGRYYFPARSHHPAAGDRTATRIGAGFRRGSAFADAAGRNCGRQGVGRGHRACRHGQASGAVDAAVDGAAVGLNGLPCAGCIAVLVRLARGVIGHHDALDLHAERALGVVRRPMGPVDGALRVSRVTARPGAELDLHRGLRVLAVGVVVAQRPHRGAAHGPDDPVGGPVDRVRGELALVVRCRVGLPAGLRVVRVPFAEVVRLHLGVVETKPLQVDLVEVVRLQHERADDSRTGCGLHGDLDSPKHDVEETVELGRIAGLGDRESRTAGAVSGTASAGCEGVDTSLREIDTDGHPKC